MRIIHFRKEEILERKITFHDILTKKFDETRNLFDKIPLVK